MRTRVVNELYIGKLVWNGQTIIKDPNTGKRQARPNPPGDRVAQEVPELRIIGDTLWNEVKVRQQHARLALTHDNASIQSERAPAGPLIVEPAKVRRLRRRLLEDRPAPLRLLECAQLRHLQQPADDPP